MLCTAALAAAGTAAAAGPPNILLINADDLGPEWLGAHGGMRAETPRIDGLAERGMLFETCFTTPVSAPSRILILTGRYPDKTGWFNMGDRPGAPRARGETDDFTLTETTFGNILRDAGYRTSLAGKWQLVTPVEEKIPASGFDRFCIWQMRHTPGFGATQGEMVGSDAGVGSRYFHPSINRQGEILRTDPDEFGPDFFADFLVEQIRSDEPGPWHIYYPMVLPHGPLGPTPHHPDIDYGYNDETLAAAVEYMDFVVGRLLDAIEESGQADNTLVIFTADNGTDRRGLKNTPNEAGARVPFIASWPGVIPEGVRSRALVHHADVLPTLASAAGVALPEGLEIDGIDLMPVLRGEQSEAHPFLYSWLGQFRIVRTRDWLLEFESPDYHGDLYFCGDARDGVPHYLEVTHYDHPTVHAAWEEMRAILATLPDADLPVSERWRFLDYLEDYHGVDVDFTRTYPPGPRPGREEQQ